MKRQQQMLKKKITFEEWKAQKDRELKKEREKWGLATVEKCVPTVDKKVFNVSKAIKKGTDLILEQQKETAKVIIPSVWTNEDTLRDCLIVKDPKHLTFREWLHNKNILTKDKMKMHRLEREQKERQALEREKIVKRAYNTWLIQSKYRWLRKYYPQLGEDEIDTMLTNDYHKLGLTAASKDVGVGDSLVDVSHDL